MSGVYFADPPPDFVSRCLLVPAKQPARPLPDALFVGFDTEYVPGERRLLSLQLAVRVGDAEARSAVYPQHIRRLTPAGLLRLLRQFLVEHDRLPRPGRGGVRRAHLVAHWAAAELGMFENPWLDFEIAPVGGAHHARVRLTDDEGAPWDLVLIDTSAFFKGKLEQLGRFLGLPKLSIDIENIEKVFREDFPAFEAYACRDAEIAVLVYTRLRDLLHQRWNIDLVHHGSMPAVAVAVFRRHFLTTPPVPVRTERLPHGRRRADGTWRAGYRVQRTFAGDVDARKAAIRAYHGGRNEAFIHGLYVGEVEERDAISMYPSAAIAQPLPVASTRWRRVRDLSELGALEGVGSFRVAFPPTLDYPSLPVRDEHRDRLMFPRRGITHATFAEIRTALKLHARVEILDAQGFEPGQAERDHDLGRYMTEFLSEKATREKGTLEYELVKLLLNAIVGKLRQRSRVNQLFSLEREAQRRNLSVGVGGFLASTRGVASLLDARTGPGSFWAPEWAALIVGRARAWIGDLVARGALLVSTDAVVIPVGLPLDGEALDELRAVGSDMRTEHQGDALFVVRPRFYALLRRAEGIDDHTPVIARDRNWAVIKLARHGVRASAPDTAAVVLRCLEQERDVGGTVASRRLLSAESALRAGREIGAEVVEEHAIRFSWDGKRRLLRRNINIFRSWSGTQPLESLERARAAQYAADVRAGKVRPRRKITDAARADALTLLREGVSLAEVERRTGVPRSTASDMRRRDRGTDRRGQGGDHE